ncbi:DUF3261 domain-containing protein [Marinomonas ostreistagni]|uniref:DUF3261 domain-containing protein n=2 Tax=Marinomonas ostreistagni TaxID=359209 RepID=A0ABS0ZBI4_9GAMM|nr:DUF3261 domain-containing protein [Marinomonas ostreistagni]
MKLFHLAVLCLMLSACSFFPGHQRQTPAPVLLAPSSELLPQILKQHLTLTSAKQSDSFIAILRLTHTQTSMVALTLAGQPFLNQSYDGQLWQSQNLSGQPLPEKEIFSMMQFALWPKASLQKNYLKENGWKLEFKKNERVAYYYEQPYLVVKRSKSNTNIEHKMGHYQVTINTFETEPLR